MQLAQGRLCRTAGKGFDTMRQRERVLASRCGQGVRSKERFEPLSGRKTTAVRGGLRVLLVSSVLVLALVLPGQSSARGPVPPAVFKAVRAYWKTGPERVKAFDVISCETGGRYNTTARNGQYLGLFQMGSFARARYGHGSSARAQARAAHAYYLDAGWNPWSCA